MRPEVARDLLVYRVLALALAERGDETWAHYADQVDYHRDAVDAAANELAAALTAEETTRGEAA